MLEVAMTRSMEEEILLVVAGPVVAEIAFVALTLIVVATPAMVVTDVTESAESLLKPPGVRSAISSSRMDRYRTDSRKSIVVLDVIQVKIVHLARTKVLDDERMRRVLQVRRPEDWRDQRSIIRVPDLELSELFSTYERPQL